MKNIQSSKERKQASQDRKYGFILILLGMAFTLFWGNMWLNRNEIIPQEELISIEGRTENKLELERRKHTGRYMIIRLKEYPNIEYKVGRFCLRGMRTHSLFNNVSMGDEIQIDVLRRDFDGIKHGKKRIISVYGLRDKNEEYVTVHDYNLEMHKNRNSIATYLLIGFGLWMVGFGIYLLIKAKSASNL